MPPNHVKTNFMGSHRKEFQYYLQVLHELRAHKYGDILGKYLRSQLNRTLVGGNKGFKGAQPKFFVEVTKGTLGGVEVKLRIFMSEGGSNKPHYVWHIINSGRAPKGKYPQAFASRKTVRYPLYRGGSRTTPRNLDVKPFSGYSGEWRSVAKGRPMPGIRPREFYRTLIPLLKNEHKKIRYKDWDLNEVVVNNG